MVSVVTKALHKRIRDVLGREYKMKGREIQGLSLTLIVGVKGVKVADPEGLEKTKRQPY